MQHTSVHAARDDFPPPPDTGRLRVHERRSKMLALVVLPASGFLAFVIGVYLLVVHTLGISNADSQAQTFVAVLPWAAFAINLALFSVPAWRTHRLAQGREWSVFDAHRLEVCRMIGWWLIAAVPLGWSGIASMWWLVS